MRTHTVVAQLAAIALLTTACAGVPADGPAAAGTAAATARSATAASPTTAEPTAEPTPEPTVRGTVEPTPEPSGDLAAGLVEGSAAAALVRDTQAHLGRWADAEVAVAEGFESIGDGITGFEHFIHWEWAADTTTLDPARPESLVYRIGSDGGRDLVSAMYALPPGSTMADVPDLGDPTARWHVHDNLCFEGRRIAGILVDGRCVPAGQHQVSVPMLHVWVEPHPCGPFADLDAGQDCDGPHNH